MKTSTSRWRSLACLATASALAVTGLAVGSPAVAAEPALPSQLSTSTESTLIRTLTVGEDGTIRFSMGQGLFDSDARFQVFIDDKYAAETQHGVVYYGWSTSANGVTTVKPRDKAKAGQRVSIVLVPKVQHGPPAPGDGKVLTSTVAGEWAQISQVDGKAVVEMSTSLAKSAKRVVLRVNKTLLAETYEGKAYGGQLSSDGDVTTLTTTKTLEVGQTAEVAIQHCLPGGPMCPTLRTLAKATATTAPNLLVDQKSSTLTIGARGDANVDRARENRSSRHSALESTGRYVKAGETVKITVPPGVSGLELALGQYGPYAHLNGGRDVQVSTSPLKPGTNTIVSDRDGLVWLQKLSGGSTTVTVSGGVAVPTFTLGQTSRADFLVQLELFAASPFAVVQGERIVAPFQRSTVEGNLAGVNDERVRFLDDVVTKTDAVYGLTLGDSGIHRKAPQRIHIANPDSGPGYAYATELRVGFQNNTGAGPDLLSLPHSELWGFWHEVGHTYQTPGYKWNGLGEVTVNISALAVQASNGWPSRLQEPLLRDEINTYLAQPAGARDYDAEGNLFVKAAMFDGLRSKFGEDFYPKLNQHYRENPGTSQLMDEAKRQYFMVSASATAGKDLTAYFLSWGLKPSPATIAAMAAYPAP